MFITGYELSNLYRNRLRNFNNSKSGLSRQIEPVTDGTTYVLETSIVVDVLADSYWAEWHDEITFYAATLTETTIEIIPPPFMGT